MSKRYKGIIKEQNNTWSIHTRITLSDGTTKAIRKRGFKTQYEAYIEKTLITSKLTNKVLIYNTNEVSEAVLEYFQFLGNTVKVTTLTSKQSLFNKHIVMPFGQYTISFLIEEKTLHSFMELLSVQSISVRHKNRIIAEYKKFLTYLFNIGKIDMNSLKNSNLIIKPIYDHLPQRMEEKKIWTLNDYKIFLSGIPRYSQDYVLFSLWGHTGVRIGEIRALQVRHVNFSLKTIKIEQQASEKTQAGHTVIISPKTKASVRTIVLSEEIIALLKEYITVLDLKQDNFLFHTVTPDKPIAENTLRRKMKMYCEKSKVSYISPHGIRHSNTTWLLSGELSLQQIGVVSERLGHNDKTTTLNIYYHINRKDQTELLELLKY